MFGDNADYSGCRKFYDQLFEDENSNVVFEKPCERKECKEKDCIRHQN